MRNGKKIRSKSYWLYLHPYVYASIKKNNALLYNTLNGERLEYHEDETIIPLIRRLNSDTNLYVVKIKEGEIDKTTSRFIDRIRQLYMGDIIDTSLRPIKPIQTKPILNLQKTFDYLTSAGEKSKILVDDEITDYLNVVNLHINNRCGQSCEMCENAYRQFLCCHTGKYNSPTHDIHLDDLSRLIKETTNSRLYRINVMGGNIFLHPDLMGLVEVLTKTRVLKIYHVHYLNICDNSSFFHSLREYKDSEYGSRLIVIAHFPLETNLFHRHMELLDRYNIPKRFVFAVQSGDDIAKAEDIVTEIQPEDYDFAPFFNGNNLDFFEEYVFLDKDSIFENTLTMNDIFSRMTLNSLNFKKLTIMADKTIYANMNNRPIGELGKNHVLDLVYRELHNGRSWTKVRKHVNPCKSCTYNALCPPISNYEYVLGKYNLCDIR